MKLGGWGRDLLDLFVPSGCAACGAWVRNRGRWVCGVCRTRLREAAWPRCPRCHHPRGTGRADAPDCLECRDWPSALTTARFAYVLEAPASDLVHALKYDGWPELAAFMGRATAAVVDDAGSDAVVVPVPTTPRRLAERGYNQAHLLAEVVTETAGLGLRPVLERPAARGSQTALTPRERRENVRGSFTTAPRERSAVGGRHVILVDDVLTTGATAGEAASVLASVGARSVRLVTFARALPRRPDRTR